MPRKPTVKTDNLEENVSAKVKNTSKKSSTTSTSKAVSEKATKKATSTTAKKDTKKKATTKKTTTKTSTAKKTSTTKKAATTKKSKTTKKVATTKTKKTTTAKTTKSRKTTKEILPEEITASTDLTKKIEILEYYDLPYRYNQTVVKVLAQTPTTLFIYWDISDDDRNRFVEQYGEDFFTNTKPILVIHNNTMHYSFEIEIDDFANSWYLHVNDANCEYSVELGRRPKYYNESRHVDIPNNYLYVTSSNTIEAPNDHVLFDKNIKTVYFKDVKTNIVTAKNITSISFLRNMGKIYNLYDIQSDFTKNAWINSNHWQLDLKNPSSGSSSTFKSSYKCLFKRHFKFSNIQNKTKIF